MPSKYWQHVPTVACNSQHHMTGPSSRRRQRNLAHKTKIDHFRPSGGEGLTVWEREKVEHVGRTGSPGRKHFIGSAGGQGAQHAMNWRFVSDDPAMRSGRRTGMEDSLGLINTPRRVVSFEQATH